MHSTKFGIVFIGLFSALAFSEPALAQKTTEAVLRVECRKTSDRGCTGRGDQVIAAPAGYYIVRDSISPGQVLNTNNRGGYRPLCGPARMAGSVPFPVPGTDIIADLFTSAVASLHVESGSGGGDLNKVFFVNCRYTYQVRRLP